MKLRFFHLLLLILFATFAHAEELLTPMQFTQSRLSYNPAYAGFRNQAELSVLGYRWHPKFIDYRTLTNVGVHDFGVNTGYNFRMGKNQKTNIGVGLGYHEYNYALLKFQNAQIAVNTEINISPSQKLRLGFEFMPSHHIQNVEISKDTIGYLNWHFNKNFYSYNALPVNLGLVWYNEQFNKLQVGFAVRGLADKNWLLMHNDFIDQGVVQYYILNSSAYFKQEIGLMKFEFIPSAFAEFNLKKNIAALSTFIQFQPSFIINRVVELTPGFFFYSGNNIKPMFIAGLYPFAMFKKQSKNVKLRIGVGTYNLNPGSWIIKRYAQEINVNLRMNLSK